MATTRPFTWFFQREPVKFRLKQLLTFKKKKRGGKRLGFVGCCGVTELKGEITQKVSLVSFQSKFGSPYQKFINPPP